MNWSYKPQSAVNDVPFSPGGPRGPGTTLSSPSEPGGPVSKTTSSVARFGSDVCETNVIDGVCPNGTVVAALNAMFGTGPGSPLGP